MSASRNEVCFSTTMQERLRKSAGDGGMTPEKAVGLFEAFISNKNNSSRTKCDNDMYQFPLPNSIIYSPNRNDCLFTIQKNLEFCGIKQQTKTENIFMMMPGQFAFRRRFITKHDCGMGCQREGSCPYSYENCEYSHPECWSIVICL